MFTLDFELNIFEHSKQIQFVRETTKLPRNIVVL